jgi:Pvc16 N-terminal domain
MNNNAQIMIYDVVNFLKQRLEAYLSEGRASAEPLIMLSNPWSNNDNNKNSSFLNAISLINVEEEKALKSQVPSVVKNEQGQYVRKEPDIKLNLYLLISAYHKNYEDGLKFLSRIVSFFQANHVFRHATGKPAPREDLPECVEMLITELFTPDFEQQNQIWGSLSMGYVPSVMYKIRMIIVDSAPAIIPVNPIKEIKSSY